MLMRQGHTRQRCWESSRSSGVATRLARAICRDLWPLSFETCWKEWCSVVRCCSVACTVSVCPRQRTTAETGPDAAAQDGVDRRRPPRRTHVGLDLGERISAVEGRRGPGRAQGRERHLRQASRPHGPSQAFTRHRTERSPAPPPGCMLCTHSVFSYVSKTVTRTPAHGTQETPVDTDARWYERVDSGGHAMVFQDMSHDDSADDMALSGAQTDQNWGRLLPSARRVWGRECLFLPQ